MVSTLVTLLITLLVLGLIVWLAFWIIDLLPIPATPKLIVKAIIGLVVLLYLLGMLFGAAPYPAHFHGTW